jgi:hypothetical protein
MDFYEKILLENKWLYKKKVKLLGFDKMLDFHYIFISRFS